MNRISTTKLCLAIIALVTIYLSGQAQTIEWFNQINGVSYDYGIASDIDSNGNVYSVGYSTGSTTIGGTVIFPNGKGDGFVIKQNKNGDILWYKTFGADDTNYYDEVQDVHVDANGDVYILVTVKGKNFKYNDEVISGIEANGQYGGNGLMLKIDANGKLLWYEFHNIKRFEAVTTDGQRNVYLTGCFYGSGTIGSETLTNSTSGTTSDMFLAKFKSDGTLIWVKHVGGTTSNSFVVGYDVSCSPDGASVYVTGLTSKTAYFETATLTTTQPNSVFLAKYNNSGTEIWAKSYDSGAYRSITSMDVSSGGLIALAGSYGYPATKSYTTFYNADGEQVQNTVYESSQNSKTFGISFNAAGEYFISGYFIKDLLLPDSTLTGEGGNSYMAKFDVNHKLKWLKHFHNTEWESGIHACNENSAIMTIRLDYPLYYNGGKSVMEPVLGDAVFMKINEEVKTAAVKYQTLNTIRIFPNPAGDEINILSDKAIERLQILNLTGQTILAKDIQGKEAKIQLAGLNPGVYLLIATGSGNENTVMKFVKE